MPCRSDYLESNDIEKELSKVAYLLDEIAGEGPLIRLLIIGATIEVFIIKR